MKTILMIHGPNLNMLGRREPEIYGKKTLKDIEDHCINLCEKYGLNIITFQSNHEGDIIDKIQEVFENDIDILGIIINAGAFTHTSYAIRDALMLFKTKPLIEVHLSNIYQREEFRKKSVFSDIATAVICGLKDKGYDAAIKFLVSEYEL